MPVRVSAALAALLLLAPLARADVASLRGKFVDPTSGAGVPQVRIVLTNLADTSDVHRATGRDDGTFEVAGLQTRGYRLVATRVGYAPLRTVVRAQKVGQDLGLLQLAPEAVNVRGITVHESPPPAVVRADTTEYRAGAVRTNPDATAEDLVQKLPGVTVESGTVKVNGEQVQQVLVNGKPFFGSDPTAAMRNLPADVVDRIQVFDKMSDQAEFSGFDDGQSQKTMNFLLRDRRAKFGKVYGGGGDQERYQAGGNASVIHGASRLTVIGMSNNVNQQNFSPQDLFGAMTGGGGGGGGPRMMMFGGPRPGGGGPGPQVFHMGGGGLGSGFDPSNFFVGQQGGLTTTHSGGLNLTTPLGKRVDLSGSVFVNQARNDDLQSLLRTYVPPQDSTLGYGQTTNSANRNANQRVDAKLEWTPDSANSVILAPRLYWQANRSVTSGSAGYSSLLGTPQAQSDNRTNSDTHGNNFTNRLTLRHRFAQRGRNLSADLSFGHTLRNNDRGQYSLTDYVGSVPAVSDTLDLVSKSHSVTNSFATRVAYTQPLVPHLQGQLTWSPSVAHSHSDARANAYDIATGVYDLPDSGQSNSFATTSTVQNVGAAVLWSKGLWRWLSNLAWQDLRLESEQTFPATRRVDQSFTDLLPSMQLNGSFANRRNLRVQWNTSTNTPSISQLQNVVDRSNPLALTAGNPDLRASHSNTVSVRWSEADPMHSKSRFVFLNVSRTSDPIANATVVATRDTVIQGIALARGTQLTLPVNLDVSWSGNLFGVYSRPVQWLKSIVSLNAGGSYTQTPTRVAAGLNVAKTWAPRAGVTFASNVSPNLDFTVSYQGTWNVSRNSLSTSTTGDYYSHVLGVRFNGIAPHGIVVREELNHSLQSGVASSYGKNAVLWNTTLGKKFLKDNRGEFRVTMTDALQQDASVSRSVTESYVQDTRDQALGRYTQAVFTYTFR